MKKFGLLLVLLAFKICTFQPPLKPLPKGRPLPAIPPKKTIKQLIEEDKTRKRDIYYDAAHLKQLDQKKIQKHAPMLILIDELQEEKIDNQQLFVTASLSYGIKQQIYPILTTASVLKNLLWKMDPWLNALATPPALSGQTELIKILRSFTPQITAQNWRIYDVPNSQFVLLIPNNFTNMFGQNLGIKPLPEITQFLKLPSALNIWLDKKKKIIPFSKKDLQQVFVPKTDNISTHIWDFIVVGHGTDNPPIIANLSPQLINEMFSFFDNQIKTGMVLVLSCYSGGGNRKLLETTQAGVQINHNFILILGSASNNIVNVFYPLDYPYFNLFYNNAAQVQDKGSSFDILWENLAKAKLFSTEESVHGFQNIPQVWFPGGIGFQSINIPDLIFSLGNVLLKTRQEDKEPIDTVGDAVVLIYPAVIDVPLYVYPIRKDRQITLKNWQNIPHIFESNFSGGNVSQLEKLLLLLNTDGLLDIARSNKASKSFYPQFISLNTSSGHIFTDIMVESDFFDENNRQSSGLGVMQFIRDSFFDIGTEGTPKFYFIDRLTGFNDISLLLAASRLMRNAPAKHPLEDYLQNFVGQNITLENITILTNNNNLQFTLYFAIEDTYWQYTSAQAQEDAKTLNWWNFKLMGNVRATYNRDYLKYKTQLVEKPDTINQKSISAVLEEKQRQMLLKKAMELKQSSADQIKKPRPLPAPPTQAPTKAPRPLPAIPSTAAKKAPRPLPIIPTQK